MPGSSMTSTSRVSNRHGPNGCVASCSGCGRLNAERRKRSKADQAESGAPLGSSLVALVVTNDVQIDGHGAVGEGVVEMRHGYGEDVAVDELELECLLLTLCKRAKVQPLGRRLFRC